MIGTLAALLIAQAAEAPAPQPAAPDVAFSNKTEADGAVLQVIFGERALIRLDDRNLPVLMKTEKGKLAGAHPAGTVMETYAAPTPGEIAVALDGSAEVKKTVMKVWNGGATPVRYDAIVLVLRAGKLVPRPVPGCAIPAKAARTQSWPAPIVAVALTKFTPVAPDKSGLGDAACK
jgi:hypothetical protein